MHAPAVGRRGGFQPRKEAVTHFVMSDFALSSDHAMMLQGRDRSKMYPANSGPVLQAGGTRNNTTVSNDTRTANFCPQIIQNDVTAPMSAGAGAGAEVARLFSPEAYAGIGNLSDIICSPQGQHKNKGNDLFLFDWPELGGLQDFETEDHRKFDSTFEIGGYYFDDPMWPSMCSPDAQLVPSSHSDSGSNSSTAANNSAANPILIDSTDSVPDTTDQINLANNPMTNTQQQSRNKGRETALNCSSSEETEHFPRLSETSLLFCPFDDMLVPTSSSIMCNDEIISSSSTLSGPDIPPCSAKKKPHATTPDMILDEMAENPLEMYFPPLKTYEEPQVPMSGTASTLQMHHQLLPEGYFAAGDGAALNSSGLEFGPKGRRASGGGSRENPRSPSVVKAAPVKHAGFQKLQDGMNQLDVGAKTCIRDALYRLANSVERRHCADHTVGSSDANRLRSSVWTETQGSPMERSVAQLLLQKPLYGKTTDRQANRVA